MNTLVRAPALLVLVILCAPATAFAQTPVPDSSALTPVNAYDPPKPPLPLDRLVPGEGVVAPVEPLIVPAQQEPTTAPEEQHFLRQIKFDTSWLPGGGGVDGVQMTDLDLSSTFAIPLMAERAPLLLTPAFGAHYWQNPKPNSQAGVPDLPAQLYDLSLEIGWRPQLAQWLFTDLAITPGLYTDFKDVNDESFKLRGRGLAVIACSRELQFVAGGLYVNRNKTKFLPAGGVMWTPNDDTRCVLVFPQPKVSRRLLIRGDVEWWAYIAGDFGGGRWEVERANGANDSLDYTDERVSVGVEAVVAKGLSGHAEVGYAFGRRINFSSDTPDVDLPSSVFLKAGFRY